MSTEDRATRQNRRNQLVLFSGLAAVALAGVAVWIGAGGGSPPVPRAAIDAELAGPGTAEETWIRRSESRIGGIESRLREMEGANRRLADDNEKLRRQLRAGAEDARAVIDRQAAVIEEMTRRAAQAPATETSPPADGFFPATPAAPSAGGSGKKPVPELAPVPLIERFDLDDAGRSGSPGGAKPLGRWLPAGSHAEAVVLAGVDASAGVASQGDPRPVLLRLTGPAWTAAATDFHGNGVRGNGAALEVDLAGCTVTGAAYGDLSSEKVYVRLRTMTCAGEAPDTVVETEVAGFVAGSGKAGVRGPVVSREGALVEKAFLAGMVSGVGQGVAGAFRPQAVATGGGAAVANTGLGDIGRAGLGAGASSAGQKVADYMIRRAEQYQPVIQLRAGTRVSVVFLEGARLDGLTEPKRPNREKSR